MIDWLKRDAREQPTIDVAGRSLPIVVRRLAQAKRMTLRLSPDGGEVRVSIPRWGQSAEALAFAHSRREWLARQLATLAVAAPAGAGGSLAYRGRDLAVEHDPTRRRAPVLDQDRLRIGGPAESLAPRLRRWLQADAKILLAQDLAFYCARAGQAAPPLALSNARRRWGSCARDGAIRINWRLVMAPDWVRRSVVAHEVAHLVHFDHSPRFHALLARLFEGDIDAADCWLKTQGRSLYAPFG